MILDKVIPGNTECNKGFLHPMPNTILVVDDQSSVRQLLQEYLTEQGFRVFTATDGQNAIYMARHEPPDLILLDIMMPKMDGYQFIRQYRTERKTPIIVITAREEETDAVMGLELGADDYVVKPFRMRELVARIQAVLRRNAETQERFELFRIGDIILDEKTHSVTVRNSPISLTPIEFALLGIFMRSPGRVFTRADLVELLADSNFTGLDNTLNVHIHNLRLKIELNPSDPMYIETVFGVGYRFQKKA
jgi:DNA-binding response OmpR family regulator